MNDPADESDGTVSIELASGTEAMMAMISSAFSLDPSDKKGLISNFKNIGQVLNLQAISGEGLSNCLRVYKLTYPRLHESLSDVRAAVIACIESDEGVRLSSVSD